MDDLPINKELTKPCQKNTNHIEQDSNQTIRYKSNGRCVQCDRLNREKFYDKFLNSMSDEERKEYYKIVRDRYIENHYEENLEYQRNYQKEYRLKNAEKVKAQRKKSRLKRKLLLKALRDM